MARFIDELGVAKVLYEMICVLLTYT